MCPIAEYLHTWCRIACINCCRLHIDVCVTVARNAWMIYRRCHTISRIIEYVKRFYMPLCICLSHMNMKDNNRKTTTNACHGESTARERAKKKSQPQQYLHATKYESEYTCSMFILSCLILSRPIPYRAVTNIKLFVCVSVLFRYWA